MRFTHPAGLPCYFVVKTPNKGAFYLCSLLFFLDLCKFLLTFSHVSAQTFNLILLTMLLLLKGGLLAITPV